MLRFSVPLFPLFFVHLFAGVRPQIDGDPLPRPHARFSSFSRLFFFFILFLSFLRPFARTFADELKGGVSRD